MARHACHRLCWLLLLAALSAAVDVDILVPEYKVDGPDAYVCTTLELPDKPMKLVGVEPIAKQEVVHHILLFGCEEPFQKPKDGKQPAWQCGATCAGGMEHILYGWGRNAPVLSLPKGVGFSVGPGSAIRYIVAQVHYLEVRPAGDHSGVKLKLEDRPVPNAAGLLSYASWFTIPPGKRSHLVQNNCCYRGWQPLTTFAMRVHTHTLGRAVYMTRPRRNGTGIDRLAIGDPQAPQGFNPVEKHVLWPGERLSVTCDFDSTKQTTAVSAGSTHTNEMCNLYMMVYSALPHIEMCADGSGVVGDTSPGNLPPAASVVPDPYPLFKPFSPHATIGQAVYGGVASVALGPDGTVWVLARGERVWKGDTYDAANVIVDKTLIQAPVVHQLHPETGKVLRSWGANTFSMPHMITVDRDGAVWVADVGLHQVLKFNDAGRLLLTIGEQHKPGTDNRHFCKPAHVTTLNNGDILVADGYCNSRVARYSPSGQWQMQYELPPQQGGVKQAEQGKSGGADMSVAHSIAVQECDGQLFVADRERARVHAFNLQTRALTATYDLSASGRVWALRPGPYGRTVALCWEQGKPAQLVDVVRSGSSRVAWTIPGTEASWPHDFALGPAALALTGAGDRLMAVYIAPLCADGCGPLQRYVLFPTDYKEPDEGVKAAEPVKPILSHLQAGGHKHHAAAKQQREPAAQQEAEQETPEQEAEDEKADQEADKEAEKAEEEKEEEEKRPEVAKTLVTKLAAVQQQVGVAAKGEDAAAAKVNSFETLYSKDYGRTQRGIGTLIAVGLVCTMLGAFVGMFAYNTMQKYVYGDRASPSAAAVASGGIGLGVRYSPAKGRPHAHGSASSIQDAVAEQEMMEQDMLLHNGRRNGGHLGV